MKNKHFKLVLKDEGFDIYAPRKGQEWGYRYGPSIMVHDGICEAWFASPGCEGEADWFTYKKSTDGGKTWSNEKVVLMPTADSMDWFSVCDPAVIYYGGYYYIGYTSTVFSHGGGVCNNAFVARSKNAEGPYEKWTGTGWGETRVTKDGTCHWTGAPAPIIYFDEPWEFWGTGEPSFVIKDDVLYIYSTWTSKRADGSPYLMTRVATADITREDWPNTIVSRGVACDRTGGTNDSFDIVYCEDLDKFIAICTDLRFSEESIIAIYESDDGLRFKRVNEIKEKSSWMLHNSGISGDCNHHIKKGDTMILGYAYGNQWGFWGTRFHFYDFEAMDEEFYCERDKENVHRPVDAWELPNPPFPIAITSVPHTVRIHEGETANNVIIWLDTTYKAYAPESLKLDNYDSSIIKVNEDGSILGLKEGYSYVDVYYGEFRVQVLVRVFKKDVDFREEGKTVIDFKPICSEYLINLKENELKELRGIATYSNGTWFEVIADKYEIIGDDVFNITANGKLTAKAEGEAKVKMTLNGISFIVKIKSKR